MSMQDTKTEKRDPVYRYVPWVLVPVGICWFSLVLAGFLNANTEAIRAEYVKLLVIGIILGCGILGGLISHLRGNQ